MSGIEDRWISRRDELIITPAESDEQRFAAFAEPFGLKPGECIFFDRDGHPVNIAPSWAEGLDRYSADEFRRAARAIADPDEIRGLWRRFPDGERVWVRRYLREEQAVGVAVEVSRRGWLFATSEDPLLDMEGLRTGDASWRRG